MGVSVPSAETGLTDSERCQDGEAGVAAEHAGSAGSGSSGNILQFAPWQSAVDEGFWHRVASFKLDTQGLEEHSIPLSGFFAPCSHPQVPSHIQLLGESLPPDPGGSTATLSPTVGNRNKCPVPGLLYNLNTLETFNGLDKLAILKNAAREIWEDIHSGKAEEDSSLLSRFLLISFADLKKWSFYYWFAFPALVVTPPVTASLVKPVSEEFSQEESAGIEAACLDWRSLASSASAPFFLLHVLPEGIVKSRPIKDWRVAQSEGGKVIAAFYDPCNLRSNPGWPLRNFLALAIVRWAVTELRILAYREKRGQPDLQESLLIDVVLPNVPDWKNLECLPQAVGWERNQRGKTGPRIVHLASTMDPQRFVHLLFCSALVARIN